MKEQVNESKLLMYQFCKGLRNSSVRSFTFNADAATYEEALVKAQRQAATNLFQRDADGAGVGGIVGAIGRKGGPACWVCQQVGHLKRDCPNRGNNGVANHGTGGGRGGYNGNNGGGRGNGRGGGNGSRGRGVYLGGNRPGGGPPRGRGGRFVSPDANVAPNWVNGGTDMSNINAVQGAEEDPYYSPLPVEAPKNA